MITSNTLCAVSVDTDCDKRRQTSRPVVGAEVQTSGNFEASLLDRWYILGCVHCLFNNAVFEFLYNLMMCNYTINILSSDFNLFLYKDFPHPPPSSKPSTRPCSTTEPNKPTEHSAIQKGSVHCTVVAVHVSRLLSTIRNIANFALSCWAIFISFSRVQLYIYCSLPKLINQPDSLLLEDRRSETGSEGHNQTSTLFLIE